jgi:hypothetical protein
MAICLVPNIEKLKCKEFSKLHLDGIHSFLDPRQPVCLFTITKKVTRYLLAKNQFSWCSLNPREETFSVSYVGTLALHN